MPALGVRVYPSAIGGKDEIWFRDASYIYRLVEDDEYNDYKYNFIRRDGTVGVDLYYNKIPCVSTDFTLADFNGDNYYDIVGDGQIFLWNAANSAYEPVSVGEYNMTPANYAQIYGLSTIEMTPGGKKDIYLSSLIGENAVFKNISTGSAVDFRLSDRFANISSSGQFDQASGICNFDVNVSTDINNPQYRHFIFQCNFNANEPNSLYEYSPGTYYYSFKLKGNVLSANACYGGRVELYSAGHMDEDTHKKQVKIVRPYGGCVNTGGGEELIFMDSNSTYYDVKVVFPQGGVTYLYNVPPGCYLVEEVPNIIIRSVGISAYPVFESGSASTNAAHNQVIFSNPMPGNIGVGDKIILDYGSAQEEIGYVQQRITDSRVALQTPTQSNHSSASFKIFRAYNTLQAWENARGGDLITRGTIEKGVCYNDSIFTSGVTISGNTTDKDHYMWLTSADCAKHHGTAGQGVVIAPITAGDNITVSDSFTIVDGLEVKGYSGTYVSGIVTHARGCIIRNNIVHDASSSGNGGIVADSEIGRAHV
jgi:hypothetical protein